MAIGFNAATFLGGNGGSGNFSASYTSGSGSGRLLVVTFLGTAATNPDSISAVTYNSVAMTLATKQAASGGRWAYLYYLVAPATGSNTLAITQTGGDFILGVIAGDYTGVNATGQPDASAQGDSGGSNVTSLTTPITVVTANSWVIFGAQQGNGTTHWANQTGSTVRASDSTFGYTALYDSAADLSAGSFNAISGFTVDGGAKMSNVVASFAPSGGAADTLMAQICL